MSGLPVQVEAVSPRDARHLLDAHHELMQSLFPAESNHYLELDALLAPEIRFFGALRNDRIIGCGALAIKAGYGEIKSMHVDETERGKGVADALLKRLIAEAKREQLPLVRLETGYKLEAAHRLYERHGFAGRGPFGEYPDDPNSLFMEKRLF